MSTLSRTLIALPVAVLAVALFTATSQEDTWGAWNSDSMSENIVLDGEGVAEGLARVVLVGSIQPESEVRFSFLNDDARRSLEVAPADGSASPGRVKDGVEIYRGLPNACAEYNPESPEALTSCTVDVLVRFEGGKENVDEVNVNGAVGAWNYTGLDEPDGGYSIEVSYDPDPPQAE